MHARIPIRDFALGIAAVAAGLVGLLLPCSHASAQNQPATAANAPTAAATTLAPLTQPWSALSKAQQQALAPLEQHWQGLSEGQKRKWIALAQNYPHMAAPEQEKMHGRMVEWAALPPKDRELARLNFAQSKKVNQTERAANWEAYQALSPEERRKLAEDAKHKPMGAAVAVKPVTPDKLAPVPATRNAPEPQRAAAANSQPLNRVTLLPKSPASAPSNGVGKP